MTARLLLRDGENISEQMLRRMLGVMTWNLQAPGGVPSGSTPGAVGKVNPNWLGVATPTGHFAVTADGSTRILTASAGWFTALKDSGSGSDDPQSYFGLSDANLTVTAPANATGSTRNDTICLRIDQTSTPDATGTNLVSLVDVAGASGGGIGTLPADGALYIPLALAAVGNGAAAITQAQMTDKRQGMAWPGANPYRFYASSVTSGQSITNNTTTKVTLASITSDPNGNFSTSTSTYYVPFSGWYQLAGSVQMNGAPTAGGARFWAEIDVNGAVAINGPSRAFTNAENFPVAIASGAYFLNQGDLVTLAVHQESTAAWQVWQGNSTVYLQGTYLGR